MVNLKQIKLTLKQVVNSEPSVSQQPKLGGIAANAKILPDLLGEVILEQEGETVFAAVELLRRGFIEHRKEPNEEKLQMLLPSSKSSMASR